MSCLCSTVLAVLAVSCTLSHIHAHGQAPQRLDRIKDLICVLLLSGMQTEDLDVAMLNKLQRYNVNISDMNNENILQECISIRDINNHNKSIDTITTTEIGEQLDKRKNNVSIKHNDDSIAQEIPPKKTDIIQYIDGHPDMQSVLKFWQDMKIERTNDSPRSKHIDDSINSDDQKNKINRAQSNSKETDVVQRFFKNVAQRQGKRDVQTSTATQIINARKALFPPIYDSYDYPQVQKDNNRVGTFKIRHVNRYADTPHEEDRTSISDIRTNKTDITLNDMQNILNTLKSYYPHIKTINSEKINSAQDSHLNKELFTVDFFSSTTERTNPKMSQNMIKEIAISVKDMVLRELRNDIMKISSTTSTTEAFTSTKKSIDNPIPKSSQNVEETILMKFMDLFNDIKSLKRNTIIISNNNKPENELDKTKPEIVNTQQWHPDSADLELRGQNFNRFGFKENERVKSPLAFQFSPQLHKFRTHGTPKTVHRVHRPTHLITVQTNNMEIPPLGIPIDISENPINQNIIVTTASYRIGPNNFENSYHHESSAVLEDYNIRQPNLNSFIQPQYDYLNHNERSNTNNREIFASFDRTRKPVSSIKPRNVEVVKAPIRFHEKLENFNSYEDINHGQYGKRIDCCNEKYAYSRQMVECCNRQIASRHQISLSTVKKQSAYDTHFNNYLKSQQKVTDMLEKILASKNRVQGVEIA